MSWLAVILFVGAGIAVAGLALVIAALILIALNLPLTGQGQPPAHDGSGD